MISKPPKHQSRPTRYAPNDSELVAQARNAVGLLEFDFFRAAWRHWHGAEPEDRALEPAFVLYLFQDRVPGYVRHFARRVLSEAALGRLDPAALGLEPGTQDAAVPDLRDPFAALSMGCLLLVCIAIAL